jgi:uncharacterized membrane protein YvlD (DUF360 family)
LLVRATILVLVATDIAMTNEMPNNYIWYIILIAVVLSIVDAIVNNVKEIL